MEYNYFTKEYAGYGTFYCLDIGQVTDSEYDKLKPIIEHLGGHWREKYKSFVFSEDVKEKLDFYLSNGVEISDTYKWKESTQFYPTPSKVAKRVVELADIKTGCSVLEPSAGTGNLLDQINVPCDIVAVEPLMENSDVLRRKGYNHCLSTFEDFYKHTTLHLDRIIMNPPFSEQRDVKHVLMAYRLLKEGGILVAIVSENALYYKTETSSNFRDFLKKHNAIIEPVAPQSFKESGTTIDVVIVKIVKE